MNTTSSLRVEKDLLGTLEISNQYYYGIQTTRALNNFSLSKTRLYDYKNFIKALAMVKFACAKANHVANKLEQKKYEAIGYACQKLIEGNYTEQFPIDMFQGGAGTSTNMNVNEVIANIALEYMEHAKGEYQYLHPNNDVNMSQSTNDVYPTAIRLALLLYIEDLHAPFNALIISLESKAIEFSNIIKMGRTQLQDAVPMTVGQEFSAFSSMLQKDLTILKTLIPHTLNYVNLGGTAIGTGVNADPKYRHEVIKALGHISQKPFLISSNLIEATSDMGDFVLLSSILKRTATKLSKIANDLRLLSSGPRTGINEINLVPKQPGSSIMPGKVNPVIPEAVNLACFQIIANDLAITLGAEAGQLQLNAMEPLIALKLFESLEILAKTCRMFQEKCIDGITVNEEHCRNLVENSIGIITFLNPYLGYEKTTQLAKIASETGDSVINLVRREDLVSQATLNQLLSQDNMVNPH